MNHTRALPVSHLHAVADLPRSVRHERALWDDTVPECWRSEAFAEDLFDVPPACDLESHRAGARHAALPLLGMALAATLGWLGR